MGRGLGTSVGEMNRRVMLQYRTEIDEKMRIVYGEKILEIESILDVDSAHQRTEIMAREAK